MQSDNSCANRIYSKRTLSYEKKLLSRLAREAKVHKMYRIHQFKFPQTLQKSFY